MRLEASVRLFGTYLNTTPKKYFMDMPRTRQIVEFRISLERDYLPTLACEQATQCLPARFEPDDCDIACFHAG